VKKQLQAMVHAGKAMGSIKRDSSRKASVDATI